MTSLDKYQYLVICLGKQNMQYLHSFIYSEIATLATPSSGYIYSEKRVDNRLRKKNRKELLRKRRATLFLAKPLKRTQPMTRSRIHTNTHKKRKS